MKRDTRDEVGSGAFLVRLFHIVLTLGTTVLFHIPPKINDNLFWEVCEIPLCVRGTQMQCKQQMNLAVLQMNNITTLKEWRKKGLT